MSAVSDTGILEDRPTADADRPRLTGYELALVALGVLLAAALAYFNLVRSPADPDMFWHIANGREMSQTHTIPQVDNLSWYGAERGLKTSTQEWLYDYGVFQVLSVGGFKLVYAVTALLFGLLFALVFMFSWLRIRRSMPSLLVAVVSLVGVAQAVAPRPQSLSFVMFVAVAILLEKRLWLLVLPIVLLVANVHGGTYPLLLALIAFYAYREKPWLIAAAAAVVVVNPQGLALFGIPFRGLTDTAGGYIQEFIPPTLNNSGFLFATLAALAVVLRNRRLPLDTGLFALALVLMSLAGARYGPYVYLIALPLLAAYFPTVGTQNPSEPTADARSAVRGRPPRWLRVLLVGELAAGVIIFCALDAAANVDIDRGYPREAVNYIRSNHITRVFNHYDQGGYLLFRGVPSLIDGRGFQFGPSLNGPQDLFSEYARVLQLRGDYRPLLRRLSISYLLLPKSAALYRALTYDQTIVTVYEDKAYAVMRWDPAR